jgi:hypothetical protein
MFEAYVACSNCPEEIEVVIDELGELDGLVCDCGYGFVLISLGEVELVAGDEPRVVRLRGDDDLPLAA